MTAPNVAPTAVPSLNDAEERRQLGQLQADPPALVVVVSDLHLGKGLETPTDRYYRRENFFADAAFQHFLEFHAGSGTGTKLLCLNGDIFDFLRIDDCPESQAERDQWSADLARLGVAIASTKVNWQERHFGLDTDPAKCVYKFKIIARGHRVFFAALAAWIRAGGVILYTKGNHDVEQHWPLIRRAFRDEIHQVKGADGRPLAAAEAVTRQIIFSEDNAMLANLYIEHGHNYETMTRVAQPTERKKKVERLNLPLGSLVNRYIINKMERQEPFLDNIKPVTDALRSMVRRNPLAVFRILWNGTGSLLVALLTLRVRHALLSAVILAAAVTYLVPFVVIAAVLTYFASAGVRQWVAGLPLLSSPTVRIGLSVGGTLLPFIVALVRALWHALRRHSKFEDEFAAGVYHRLEGIGNGRSTHWQRRYAVLGHTHQQDAQSLPPPGVPGAPVLYLNSGTWVPLWPQDRPDLMGKVLYSFIRFERHNEEYRHESLVWDDETNSPRPAQLLATS